MNEELDTLLLLELTEWARPIHSVLPMSWEIQEEIGSEAAGDFIYSHHIKWN